MARCRQPRGRVRVRHTDQHRGASMTWQKTSNRRPCAVCGRPGDCVYTGDPSGTGCRPVRSQGLRGDLWPRLSPSARHPRPHLAEVDADALPGQGNDRMRGSVRLARSRHRSSLATSLRTPPPSGGCTPGGRLPWQAWRLRPYLEQIAAWRNRPRPAPLREQSTRAAAIAELAAAVDRLAAAIERTRSKLVHPTKTPGRPPNRPARTENVFPRKNGLRTRPGVSVCQSTRHQSRRAVETQQRPSWAILGGRTPKGGKCHNCLRRADATGHSAGQSAGRNPVDTPPLAVENDARSKLPLTHQRPMFKVSKESRARALAGLRMSARLRGRFFGRLNKASRGPGLFLRILRGRSHHAHRHTSRPGRP